MPSKSTHRTIAELKLPKPIPDLITYARAILSAMNANPNFPNPSPPLGEIGKSVDDLESAEKIAQGRARGSALARDEKRTAMVAKLQLLKSYVQTAADANHAVAADIITSAAMVVRKVPTRAKRTFQVRPGPVSGSVKVLVPSAGHRVAYDWEYSADGGSTWQQVPSTLQASTTVSGLVVGSTYEFRYRVVGKTGAADWSAPVSFKVP
jgi:hypothetical protein